MAFGSNCNICFSSCFIIHSLVYQYSLRYYWYCHIMRSSRPELLCKNDVLANFAKFTRKDQKDIPLQMFSCEFWEISHNTFFKEPFGQLLLDKHSLCLFSSHDLSPFQKRCRTFFLAKYFFGFICRLGTKVSWIYKTLSQKPIFNLVKHLGWSFSCERVNSSTPLGIFAKKLHCRCSSMF